MIEETSTVTAVDGKNISVKSELKSGCSGCNQVDNCASGQVAKAIPQLSLSMQVIAHDPVNVGEKVVIGIPEKALLSTAAKVYLFPLFGLILSSGLGQYLIEQAIFTHELYALMLGFSGGFLGYFAAKIDLASAKKSKLLTPKYLRKVV